MRSLKFNLRRLKSRIFLANGRRPYARGYFSYRQIHLPQYIHRDLPEGKLPEGWGLWLDERAVEYPWFFSRLPGRAGNLLDAGSVLNHEYVLSHEKLKNKKISIYTLAPETESHWNRGISYVYGDLRECSYRSECFDWVVSLSTLEHVGMDNTLFYTKDRSKNEYAPESHLQALLELRRVLKDHGVLYLTLPFGRSQSLGWLQIFDSAMVEKVIAVFQPRSVSKVYFRYTKRGWQFSSADDCSEAGYFDSSQGQFRKTDFAAAEAAVCLELVK